jgi:hypothetical protein
MTRDNLSLDLSTYFRSKSKQLLAASEEAIVEHGTLQGSHREAVLQIYLNELLPKRFETSKGIVYDLADRSKEADIVIWDAQNYPQIPLKNHSAFFAESVKAVVEVKSRWSEKNLNDIKDQCNCVRNLIRIWQPNLVERVGSIEAQLDAIYNNEPPIDVVFSRPHIAIIGIVLKGGKTIEKYLTEEAVNHADFIWPDLLILLEAGIVVVKNYEPVDFVKTYGYIEIIDADEDALLYFTATLNALLTERIGQIEDPWYMRRYALNNIEKIQRRKRIEFPVMRPAAQGFIAP